MKLFFTLIIGLVLLTSSCNGKSEAKAKPIEKVTRTIIDSTLNQWHDAAANADYERYFELMTNDGIFIGTDPTENWELKAFKTFSKPYFDKGKAWSFKAIERNVYFSDDFKIAWFDELLDTQMKLCRGSGILKKEDDSWKIAHYVLSIAIPNENVSEVIQIKKDFDSVLTRELGFKNSSN